jgi:hypothetical protein
MAPLTKNTDVKKYLNKNIPYVAGSSGMANAASTIFDLLDIDILSEQSHSFMESMSAFIVGSGMHSYKEVYDSFNTTLKHKLNVLSI